MRVKVLSRIGDPQPLIKEASVVLIEDNNGTVVGVAVSLPDNMGCVVAHADDPDFNRVLRELGIDRLTICADLDQTPVEKLALLNPL